LVAVKLESFSHLLAVKSMTLDIRWLAPAAIVAIASAECFAVPYMSFAQAQALIFPEAKTFVPAPVTMTPEQIARIEKQCGVPVNSPNQRVWLAQVDGKTIGWFIIDEVLGKKEFMIYGVGIAIDGAVRQIQIINYRENYGYEVKGAKWREQFAGKTIADAVELGVDIKNISGSTLSSRHITEGVKRLLAFHQVVLRQ
jgi:Na+-translocating ferredoxin:NAD+ oxidoreductase RnfG subunit